MTSNHWRVMIGSIECRVDLTTLKGWVHSGILQPNDRVQRDALPWISAGRAPGLRGSFAQQTRWTN